MYGVKDRLVLDTDTTSTHVVTFNSFFFPELLDVYVGVLTDSTESAAID